MESGKSRREMRLRERDALRDIYGDTIGIINGGPANSAILPKDMAFAYTGKPGPWFNKDL